MLLASLPLGFTACDDDDDYTIETQPIIQGSVVTSNADVTAVTATCYGTVNGLESQAASSFTVGTYFVKGDADPKTGTRVVGSYGEGGVITASLSGLETGVTYSYCAYVTLQGRLTYYGDTKQFTTFDASVVTEDAKDVTGAKASLGGTASNTGNVSGLSCGFRVSTDPDLVKVGYDVGVGALSSSSFQYDLSGLLPNTTYYYIAYVNLGTGYAYGEPKSFTTGDVQFEYVDLGLSAQWATCNVGAEKVTDVGVLAGYGDPTGLQTTDDASYYASGNIYGGKFDIATAVRAGRLPTLDEVKELVNQCTYQWITVDGVEGAQFTAPNGNSVFFPAAGYWTGVGSASSSSFAEAFEVNSQSANLTAQQVVNRLAIRPVKRGSSTLDASLICNTWYIDLDQFGTRCVFDGPLYYYGTDDTWASVTDGDIVAGDSWNWCPKWSENTWIQAAADFGTMTFSEDGKVVVNDLGNNATYEGTYTVDAASKTLSLEGAKILHLPNIDAVVTNWSTDLKIMSLTDKSMQIAALRDNSSEGPCLLVHNYVTEDAQFPVWQGVPAGLEFASGDWAASRWDGVNTKTCTDVTGFGQYTVSGTVGAGTGLNVFCVDLMGYKNFFGEKVFDNTEVTLDEIKVDGQTIEINPGNIVYGDFENNGNLRIEIYNTWGYTPEGAEQPSTVANPVIPDAANFKVENDIAVTFTLVEKAKGYTANFATCDTNWNWKDHNSTFLPVEGETYTFVAADAQTNGMIDIIDIEGFATDYPNAIFRIDDIKVDGMSITFDANRFGYGDIEGKGNYRFELFNCYGATHEMGTDAFGGTDPASAAALACNEKIEVTVTLVSLDGYTAGLTTCDSNWNSTWPDASILLTLAGVFPMEYTVSVEGSRANGMIDLVEIKEIMKNFPGIQLTLTKVAVDGTEVAFDASKILYGDLEGNGNYRIELYNTYGASKGNAAFEGETADGNIPALGFNERMDVTFTLDKLY